MRRPRTKIEHPEHRGPSAFEPDPGCHSAASHVVDSESGLGKAIGTGSRGWTFPQRAHIGRTNRMLAPDMKMRYASREPESKVFR